MIHWPSLGRAMWDVVKWATIFGLVGFVIGGIAVITRHHPTLYALYIISLVLSVIVWTRYNTLRRTERRPTNLQDYTL